MVHRPVQAPAAGPGERDHFQLPPTYEYEKHRTDDTKARWERIKGGLPMSAPKRPDAAIALGSPARSPARSPKRRSGHGGSGDECGDSSPIRGGNSGGGGGRDDDMRADVDAGNDGGHYARYTESRQPRRIRAECTAACSSPRARVDRVECAHNDQCAAPPAPPHLLCIHIPNA